LASIRESAAAKLNAPVDPGRPDTSLMAERAGSTDEVEK